MIEIEVDDHKDEAKQSPCRSENQKSESLRELKESIDSDFQAVHVQWEDIVRAASRAKKSTGGGLCQITPWHLKSAILNSSGNKNVPRYLRNGRTDGQGEILIQAWGRF